MSPQFLAGAAIKGCLRSRVSVCASRNARAAPALFHGAAATKGGKHSKVLPSASGLRRCGCGPLGSLTRLALKSRGRLAAAQVPKQLSFATSRRSWISVGTITGGHQDPVGASECSPGMS